ncbi:proteasome subunit beta type-2 [Halyomorpha halys]|uniref:proteasome subunit beta type-2 n=1 Tax=Halyomorpha halys TaxID=286706 RepID=UPI0006D52148|nr:proteasome subunit beta type-2-like [Halyomorpha halys]
METILGIACEDFAMIATDCSTTQSILVMKTDEKKIFPLGNNIIMGVTGTSGDTSQFAEYIGKNVQLYKMRNGYELTPSAAAHFTRHNLADYLRSQTPYQVNLLLAGFDKENGGELYFLDYLASFQKVPFAAHGYGGLISYSILDRYAKKDMTQEEGYNVLKLCIAEIQRRLIVNLPNFSVQVVDRNGNRELKSITKEDIVEHLAKK